MIGRSVCFLVLGFVTNVAVAENPFGIPESQNAKRPGTILLHGGGRLTDEVFERFVELAGGRAAHIVLVPSAGFDTRNYDSIEEFNQAVRYRYNSWVSLKREGRIADFTILHTEDPDDAERQSFVRPLLKATGVWFTGGDQGRLNYRYVGNGQNSRYQIALKNVVQRGGVVGGTSAGTAILPEITTMWSSQDYSGSPLTARIAHGFGLMDRVIVEQHFDTRVGRLERFVGLLKDNDRLQQWSGRPNAGAAMMGLAVDEPATAELSRSSIRVWGPGHVHLFVKRDNGRMLEWHDIEPDHRVHVQADDVTNTYAVSRVD